MIQVKEAVLEIIKFYDEHVEKPVRGIVTFRDMMVSLLRFIKHYEPIENQDYALNEAHFEFTKYIYDLERAGNLTEEQRKDTLELFRANLVKHFMYNPLKTPLADRLFNRARTYLEEPDVYTNPFETMSPEYVYKFHHDCMRFEKYIRSEDYMKILDKRLLPYYDGDSTESLAGGHINERKIEAVWKLIKEFGYEPSEEFTMLVKLVKEMKEKELNEGS